MSTSSTLSSLSSPTQPAATSSSKADTNSVLRGKRVLVGVSGSVAAIRIPRLLGQLKSVGAHVRLVSSDRARHFLTREDAVPLGVEHFTDADEWESWKSLSDSVLHIELRKWAELFLIAPTSANTLGKIANGLCDDLLSCIARAWPLQDDRKRLILAPAMNTMMWQHPVTKRHLDEIEQFSKGSIIVLPPISKQLACGDVGVGAMQTIDQLFQALSFHATSISS